MSPCSEISAIYCTVSDILLGYIQHQVLEHIYIVQRFQVFSMVLHIPDFLFPCNVNKKLIPQVLPQKEATEQISDFKRE